ncbi:nuclear migration and anchoring protein unc-84 [Ditylenchus destructor]|nr:nuclear migration and anchoring protein unc-84 [Ditylenchus destructor]
MIFGILLWYSSYSPSSIIQRKGHGVSAGECWPFVGPHGYLTIKLSQNINVTAASYEHLPVQLSPNGHIQTAPKNVLVYSYQDVDDLDSLDFCLETSPTTTKENRCRCSKHNITTQDSRRCLSWRLFRITVP